MTAKYETLYARTPEALGAQTPAVAAALERLPAPPLTILDIGAGQGRNALPLARRGHRVTAVDTAPTGLAQLAGAAAAEDLVITTLAADITRAIPTGPFDVLLADRTFHMIPDPALRERTLANLLAVLAPEGFVIVEDERANIPGLSRALGPEGRWDWCERTASRIVARRLA